MTKDEKISSLEAEIEKLEAVKKAREKKLADPTYQQIKKLWEEVAEKINQLESLGEDISDVDGNSVVLNGRTFSLNHDGEIVEGEYGR